VKAAFSQWLKGEAKPFLHDRGFMVTRGGLFSRSSAEMVHLIEFQRSSKSTAAQVIFTINLAAASRVLWRHAGIDARTPSLDSGHWKQRIGLLMKDPSDCWWTASDQESLKRAGADALVALEAFGLPALDAFSSNAALRDLWLAGRSPGLTMAQRIVNLSVLLEEIGPKAAADAVLLQLKDFADKTPLPLVTAQISAVERSRA